MEWLDKIKDFPNLIKQEPRPGSTGGNFWMNLLGPKTFRFWLGVILAVGIGLSLYLFSISGK